MTAAPLLHAELMNASTEDIPGKAFSAPQYTRALNGSYFIAGWSRRFSHSGQCPQCGPAFSAGYRSRRSRLKVAGSLPQNHDAAAGHRYVRFKSAVT